MFYLLNKYIISLLLCFFIFVFICPSFSLAKTEMTPEQQAFLDFEDKISNLVISSVKPLSNLDQMNGKLGEEELYNFALSVEENFAINSEILAELQVPNVLPDDIKVSLKTVKGDLLLGFRELEESMNYFAQYMASRNSIFYDRYTKKRNNGSLYIDGGLTSLSTVGLRLNVLESSSTNVQKTWKKYLYKLEQISSMIK